MTTRDKPGSPVATLPETKGTLEAIATANTPLDLAPLVQGVLWIADAPLFIDVRFVEKIFDAVVRPKYEHVGLTQTDARDEERELATAKGIKAGFALPPWLTPVLPSFTVNYDRTEKEKDVVRTSSISQLRPVWNAERQLEELTRHYVFRHPDRLVVWGSEAVPEEVPWYCRPASFFKASPRALAFLDLPPGTKLIPTAAEFANGTVELLFEDLVGRLTSEDGTGPWKRYPDKPGTDSDALRAQRREYWRSFDQRYSATQAMLVIEAAAKRNGRINWIDFRLPLDADGNTLHLHVVADGRWDAGVFGYNFVRRAYKHGVRIVGTLKSEPDMNVLAIFDT